MACGLLKLLPFSSDTAQGRDAEEIRGHAVVGTHRATHHATRPRRVPKHHAHRGYSHVKG
eukprot:349634-Chlamydomonas_euryale.AAC.19